MKYATLFKFSFIIYVLIFTTNCGINRKYKTPEKPSEYPVFTIKDSLKGCNYFQRICYDVTYYDIHLSFNINKKSIEGFVETTFNLDKISSEIQVDLDEQFIIDSITQNNKKLDYKRIYTAIFISLSSTKKQQQMKIYYHGVPKKAKKAPWEGGFVWKKIKKEIPLWLLHAKTMGQKPGYLLRCI